jgi:hypothetical protein
MFYCIKFQCIGHSHTTESFIPSTVKLWNRLDQSDRNLDTLNLKKPFKRNSQIIQNVSQNIFIMVPESLILFLPNFVTLVFLSKLQSIKG